MDQDALVTAWKQIVESFANDPTLGKAQVGFLDMTEPLGILSDTVLLSVPNEYTKGVIEGGLAGTVEEALSHAFGRPLSIAISVKPIETTIGSKPVENPQPPTPAVEKSDSAQDSGQKPAPDPSEPPKLGLVPNPNADFDTHLNAKYTFETFVIGSSNRFAHAAANAAAETPARAYNPLFIYGGSGLGKTHLLHAIGHYALNLYPAIKVLYVNSEEFTNDFINSISAGRAEDFQRRYRDIDILLIDDIQFLQGKEQTVEEFFHTFNTLYNADKQVVITSDVAPKELGGFEERMRSRFEMGLMTDVQPPDLETRIAILRKKAQAEGLEVDDDTLSYIASRFATNIRELEGALLRVTAFASLSDTKVSRSLAEMVLKDIVSDPEDPEVTPALIKVQTAEYFGVTLDQLCSADRSRALSEARQIAMYLCRELTTLSLPKIGQEFGGRDHTTVMHAQRKITEQMAKKPQTFNHVTELTNRIKQKARG
ncbi:chromosomal replication initiator protein DnaA [Winkia sp. UMB3158]|uniref:chromosomal replication initiator protein DnaA n=1 Tax=unclassified Winkia TaxID=2692119 RepID=UPI002556D7EC|nr:MULTISPECIES: chromosomal replication initiator protein DnaA [unclassified Winkia]MDK7148894.1 chromosomal replication initiator protein DnaA [Winkia sp. UMB3158]MDK8340342.1 chromosomal replication initiator protein DnaA [Winkia sp. UMB3164B]MDK8564925.1 chromosomal replication initiator protein DnaA [Winkia sp. UMB3164A]